MIPGGMSPYSRGIKDAEEKFEQAPKGLNIAYVVTAVLVLLLLGSYWWWCEHRASVAPAGIPIVLPPAVEVAKEAGPVLSVPLQVVPGGTVAKVFPKLKDQVKKQPVIDSAKIPSAPHGGSTVTFMNLTTGTASTVFIPQKAPWFAFEGGNEVYVGIEDGNHGRRVPLEYRRDILAVKDLHLVARIGGKVPIEPGARGEWNVGAGLAYRW